MPNSIWELLSKGPVVLQFKNMDTKALVSVYLKDGFSMKSVPSGLWELVSFKQNQKVYRPMNDLKKFVLTRKLNSYTYAGSVVIGCPVVRKEDYHSLKKLNYFNRYSFRSDDGLCEVVIGDNIKEASKVFRELSGDNKDSLELGF